SDVNSNTTNNFVDNTGKPLKNQAGKASTVPNSKGSNVFLKYAYVEGKLAGKAAVLRLGLSHTPWIDYEQGLWKHRYVSKVAIDQYKYDSSSDLGVGLKGKLSDGMFGYWVTATNGEGYGTQTNNKTAGTGTDYNIRLGAYPVKGLTLDVQYRHGFMGTKSSAIGAPVATLNILNQVMVTYGVGHDYRIGANYIKNIKKLNSTQATTAKEDTFALWGWGNFGDGLGAFGRFESVKDKFKTNPQKKTRYVLGAEYSPVKNIKFSLAYDHMNITNLKGFLGDTQKLTRYGLYSQMKF
ncbi:MAG: hypothetical protein Q9M09_05060, partial [Mariprofundaceae bacterium]|nr:hypothetical protein [Mariprofundaceae bacterium]